MKVKTSALIGPALRWAVAKAEGQEIRYLGDGCHARINDEGITCGLWHPDIDWAQGGPIIEREDISFRKYHNPKSAAHGTYYAKVCRESGEKVWWTKRDMVGPTPLIAAMRCRVASKLGDEVDVPEGLS